MQVEAKYIPPGLQGWKPPNAVPRFAKVGIVLRRPGNASLVKHVAVAPQTMYNVTHWSLSIQTAGVVDPACVLTAGRMPTSRGDD